MAQGIESSWYCEGRVFFREAVMERRGWKERRKVYIFSDVAINERREEERRVVA